MAAKKSDASPTKHYVLDTNVLIHDPQSMFQFEDNIVWIPVEVLEELDRFKANRRRAARMPARCTGG